ncbi:MAG: ABC transporter ATP-binding protein, partial [Cyclobacteriaceae bacterium]
MVGILDALGLTILVPFLIDQISGAKSDITPDNNFIELIVKWGFPTTTIAFVFLILAIVFFKFLLRGIHLSLMASTNSAFTLKLRTKIVDLISHLDYRHYVTVKTGHLVNSATGEATKYATSQKAYVESISFLSILFGYALLIFLTSWKLSFALLILGLVANLLYKYLHKLTRGLSRNLIEYNREFNGRLIEAITHFKYLKATSRFSFFGSKLTSLTKKFTRNQFLNFTITGIPNVIQEVVIIAIIASLYFINYSFVNEPLSVILIILAISYRASGTLTQFQSRKQVFYSGIGSIESITKLIDEFGRHQEVFSTDQVSFRESIIFENISLSYNKQNVISAVDLEIPINKIIAIIGSSGAGKTTLIDILSGVLKPDSGKLFVDQVEYKNLAIDQWRRQVAYITQETMVFDGSVIANITMGQQHEVNDQALNNALTWACCDEFVRQLPNGLNTQLGERGLKLSGGQRQRIAIARELYKMPSLLIMDEATSALDSESERIIQRSIENLKGRITIV